MVNTGRLTVEDRDDEMPLRMAMGMAWEDWAVGLWPDMEWQPGELCRDGIYGSPDGRSILRLCLKCGTPATEKMREFELECPCGGEIRGTPVIEEFKMTYKSAFTHPILNETLWLYQGGGYCAMTQPPDSPMVTGYLPTEYVRLHINWLNGTYRPPSPVYATYLIRFEKEWTERLWREVVLKNLVGAEPEV